MVWIVDGLLVVVVHFLIFLCKHGVVVVHLFLDFFSCFWCIWFFVVDKDVLLLMIVVVRCVLKFDVEYDHVVWL